MLTTVMAETLEPFYRDLGRRVRQLREQRNMTQTELGQLLRPKVTRASIANLEGGTQRVLAHTLPQLAISLGVSVPELIPAPSIAVSPTPQTDRVFEELRRLAISETSLKRLTRKLKLSL